MLGDALRYPVRSGAARTASAWSIAVVLAAFVLADLTTSLWPSWTAILPAMLVLGPVVLFVGHLTALLRGTATTGTGTGTGPGLGPDTIAFRLSRSRIRLGLRTLTISLAYLLVPGLLIAAGGYLIASGSIPGGVAGLAASIIATVALLVVVSFAYLLPGAITVGAREGLRAALRRSAFQGLASASYFVAWTGAAVLAVLAWGAISLTTAGTIGGFLAIGWFTYAHLVAARLLGRGLQRLHRDTA